jgi:hypothetical protein
MLKKSLGLSEGYGFSLDLSLHQKLPLTGAALQSSLRSVLPLS